MLRNCAVLLLMYLGRAVAKHMFCRQRSQVQSLAHLGRREEKSSSESLESCCQSALIILTIWTNSPIQYKLPLPANFSHLSSFGQPLFLANWYCPSSDKTSFYEELCYWGWKRGRWGGLTLDRYFLCRARTKLLDFIYCCHLFFLAQQGVTSVSLHIL